MNSLIQNRILNPQHFLLTQVRFKRANTKRERTHYDREVVKIAIKPKYPRRWEYLPIEELCGKAILKTHIDRNEPPDPLTVILAKELQDEIVNAKLVVLFHAHPCTKEELYDLRVILNKLSLKYIYAKTNVINLALKNTSYEALLRVFEAKSHIFVGEEAHFTKLWKTLKKSPIVSFIGGVYEERILSIRDFEQLANSPTIETHLAQVCSLLNITARKLSSNLNQQQAELCSSLQRYTDEAGAKEHQS